MRNTLLCKATCAENSTSYIDGLRFHFLYTIMVALFFDSSVSLIFVQLKYFTAFKEVNTNTSIDFTMFHLLKL